MKMVYVVLFVILVLNCTEPKPASSLSRSVLDAPTFKQIAHNISQQLFREKLQEEMVQRKQTPIEGNQDQAKGRTNVTLGRRRYENKYDHPFELVDENTAWEHTSNLNFKAFDLMKQAVYQTRYHLQRTKPFRKRYEDDPIFRIGVLYGSMTINKNKIEALWWQMRKFHHEYTKLLTYLVVYEKILATHTDISFGMKTMFDLFKTVQENMKTLVQDSEEEEGKGLKMISGPMNKTGEEPPGEDYGKPAGDPEMDSQGGFNSKNG